jgi:hypothetical protein
LGVPRRKVVIPEAAVNLSTGRGVQENASNSGY